MPIRYDTPDLTVTVCCVEDDCQPAVRIAHASLRDAVDIQTGSLVKSEPDSGMTIPLSLALPLARLLMDLDRDWRHMLPPAMRTGNGLRE